MFLRADEPAIVHFPQGLAAVSYSIYLNWRTYFADPRVTSGLFELWLNVDAQGGLALRASGGALLSVSAADLVDRVRNSRWSGEEIRLVVANPSRVVDELRKVAHGLRTILWLAEDGTQLQFDANAGMLMFVDPTTKAPKDWKPLPPGSFPVSLSPSFESVNGMLRARRDLVGIPMNGGVVNVHAREYVARAIEIATSTPRSWPDVFPVSLAIGWGRATQGGAEVASSDTDLFLTGRFRRLLEDMQGPRRLIWGPSDGNGHPTTRWHQAPVQACVPHPPPQRHRGLV